MAKLAPQMLAIHAVCKEYYFMTVNNYFDIAICELKKAYCSVT